MPLALAIIVLVVLFVILSRGANLVVTNVKIIADKLGLQIFVLGLILGVLTTLPELMVGFNALVNDVGALSVGNLLGGLVVVLTLVPGLNLLLNRPVVTDGQSLGLIPIALFLYLPIILGLDGKFSGLEGAFLVAVYIGLFAFLYRRHRLLPDLAIHAVRSTKIARELLLMLIGVIIVVISANFIVKTTLVILADLPISAFFVGLIIFAIGTNLPELFIAFTSTRRQQNELSVSYIFGSTMANILLLGLFSIIRTQTIPLNSSYLLLAIMLALALTLFLVFYHTGKQFTRREGFIMLVLYGVYLTGELIGLAVRAAGNP